MFDRYPALTTQNHAGIRFYDHQPPGASGDVAYVLLHGIGTSLDFWTGVAPLLSGVSRTIALDIPGFGRSSLPTDGFSLDSVSNEIADLLETLSVKSCVIVAHSLGGAFALTTAKAQPALVNRLILVSATLISANELLRHPETAFFHPKLGVIVATQFLAAVVPIHELSAALLASSSTVRRLTLWPFVESPDKLDPALLSRALSNTGGSAAIRTLLQARLVNLADMMVAVPQPVDLVWGADDLLIGSEDIDRSIALLDVERRLEIEGCGHWPMIEAPALLTDFIIGWKDYGKS